MADTALNNSLKVPGKARKKKKSPTRDAESLIDQSEEDTGRQTKERMDQLMSSVLSDHNQTQDKKTKRKKKKAKNQEDVLESLRNGHGFRKDEEDTTLLANTYDPDDMKSRKSNKRQQKEREEMKGNDNQAYDDTENVPKKTKKKPIKKLEFSDRDINISDMAPQAKNNDTQESLRQDQKKKKKKKNIPSPREEDETQDEQPEVQRSGEMEGEMYGDRLMEEEAATAESLKHQKKRRKKKKPPEETVEEPIDEGAVGDAQAAQEEAEPEPEPIPDEGKIVGVVIHRTDKLKTDFFISHPLVRISAVDMETGKYLKKQTMERPVVSYYEKDQGNIENVLPILTKPFDFKQNKSTLPIWEEMVLFNENYNYFTTDTPKVMFFFEVVDFVSMNTASQKYNNMRQDGGWHRIAWGFLKVVGANGEPNANRKVRLQLYQPPMRFRLDNKSGQLEVYQWWKNSNRVPYPSTLYVTMKSIVPPETMEPAARSMFPIQEEQGKMSYAELTKAFDTGTNRNRNPKRKEPSVWNRLPGQVCKIPNNLSLTLSAGRQGCFTVKFSPDGKLLACGCHDRDGYPITIYEIPSGKLKGKFLGHFKVIYQISWSKNNKELLTASSDGTSRIWDVETMSGTPLKVLPHPSFVYTAKFHNKVNKLAVTGCYDKIIRIWYTGNEGTHAQLMQELDGHMGHVNSLCFDNEGSKMYSVDSLGHIIFWNVYATDQPSKRGILKDWTKNEEIIEEELNGVPISNVVMHPAGKRLLLHCKNNCVVMFDLRVNRILQRFIGALNFREHIRSAITPCGSFVISGSEDCASFVWNAQTGDQVASYLELGYKHPVTDVDYHPHDHVVALCALGDNHPVLVYNYSFDIAQRDAGFPQTELHRGGTIGRPMSPEIRGVIDTTDDEGLETSRSRLNTTRDEFKASESHRRERIIRKLHSVSGFSRPPTSDHPLAVPPSQLSTMLTYGSTTMDTTTRGLYTAMQEHERSRAVSPVPSAFSPHASRSMDNTLAQQQFSLQSEYLKSGQESWRPEFSAVGKHGSLHRSPSPSFRGTQIGLNYNQGKAQFSFQGPIKATGTEAQGHNITERPPKPRVKKPPTNDQRPQRAGRSPRLDQVIAVYDYQGQRADELSFMAGDVITVLYEDNENWSMGQLSDGAQGYFPSNYVTYQNTKNVSVQIESQEEYEKSQLTAIKTRSGELKFVSGTEDSDMDTPIRRKKKSRSTRANVTYENEESPVRPARKKKSKAKVQEDLNSP